MKEVNGLRSTNWLLQNSHGDVKYSIGNIIAKECMCLTHGEGQLCREGLRKWVRVWVNGDQRGKIGTTVIA